MQTGYTSGPDLQKNILSVNTDINPFHKLSINNSKIFRPHCQKNGSVSIVPIILCHVRLHGDVEFVFFFKFEIRISLCHVWHWTTVLRHHPPLRKIHTLDCVIVTKMTDNTTRK